MALGWVKWSSEVQTPQVRRSVDLCSVQGQQWWLFKFRLGLVLDWRVWTARTINIRSTLQYVFFFLLVRRWWHFCFLGKNRRACVSWLGVLNIRDSSCLRWTQERSVRVANFWADLSALFGCWSNKDLHLNLTLCNEGWCKTSECKTML